MGIPSGASGQIGFKSETVFATGVTVDKFVPFVSLGIETMYEQMPIQGIYAGRRTQTGHKPGRQTVSGSFKTELNNKPAATLLGHMFGTCVDSGSGPYLHTASPGSLTAKSMTVQGGLPDAGGTVRPFTWTGVKLPQWSINATVGQIASIEHTISGKAENVTGTPALAAASFLSAIDPFSFVQASMTVAGNPIGVVNDVTLTGSNGLKVDRFGLGSATVAEQLENDMRAYTGTINTEFTDLTLYNLFVTGSDAAMVLTFSNGTDTLVFTTNAYFGGKTPPIDSRNMLKQSIPFICESSTSDAGCITAVLTNAETVST